MGEIAEMMLEGVLCAFCGEALDDDGAMGFPRYCSKQCAAACCIVDERPRSNARANKAARINRERQEAGVPKAFHCKLCSKRFRYTTALGQHERDKHAAVSA